MIGIVLTARHRPAARGGHRDDVRSPLVSTGRARGERAGVGILLGGFHRSVGPPASGPVDLDAGSNRGANLRLERGAQGPRGGASLARFPPAADVPRALEHHVEVTRSKDAHVDPAAGTERTDAALANLEAAYVHGPRRSSRRPVPPGCIRIVGVIRIVGDTNRRGVATPRFAVYVFLLVAADALLLLFAVARVPLFALSLRRLVRRLGWSLIAAACFLRGIGLLRRRAAVLGVSQRDPPRSRLRRVVPPAYRRQSNHPHPALRP